MEDNEVEYEEDRLEVTWTRIEDSEGATSVSAASQKGKSVAVTVFTMGRRTIQTQSLPWSWLRQRREPSRTKMGTLNIAKTLQSRVF